MSDAGQTGQQEGENVAAVVLVADDNDRYREGIVRALARRAGIGRVVEATDGAAALQLVRELVPDVALVDWRMPILDGPSIARAVHDDPALAVVRVIVMSADDDEEVQDAARTAGAAAFVDKATARSEICALVLGDRA